MRIATTAMLALGVIVSLCGCKPIEPWVKPYEHEHLNDPIMSLNRDPISTAYRNHVFQCIEGSRGATGTVGRGFGCN